MYRILWKNTTWQLCKKQSNFVWGHLEKLNVCKCPWLPLICVAILAFTQHKTRFIIWHFPYASLCKSNYLHKYPFTSRTFYTRHFVKHLYCQGHRLLLCETISLLTKWLSLCFQKFCGIYREVEPFFDTNDRSPFIFYSISHRPSSFFEGKQASSSKY